MTKKQEEQIMMSQMFADGIEHILRGVFCCDRLGFGGQVNSDNIRRHPFLSMTQGLAYLYAISPEKRNEIEKFINDFSFYEKMSIDNLLSFDKKTKKEGIVEIELSENNGIETLEKMIEEFKQIIYS